MKTFTRQLHWGMCLSPGTMGTIANSEMLVITLFCHVRHKWYPCTQVLKISANTYRIKVKGAFYLFAISASQKVNTIFLFQKYISYAMFQIFDVRSAAIEVQVL